MRVIVVGTVLALLVGCGPRGGNVDAGNGGAAGRHFHLSVGWEIAPAPPAVRPAQPPAP